MKPRTHSWLMAAGLSICSGILLAQAMPPSGHGFVGWFALLPLLLTSRLAGRPSIAAGYGLLCVVSTAGAMAGAVNALPQFGNLIGAFGGLGLLLALASALSQVASSRLGSTLWAVATAGAGAGGELVCASVFPVTVALSQFRNPAALQIASVTGIWGVSFLLWLIPAMLIAAAVGPRRLWAVLGAAVGVLLLTVTPNPPASGPLLKVSAVQAEDAYSAQSLTESLRGTTQLVVWPELLLASEDRRPGAAARASGTYVAASFAGKGPDGERRNYARIYAPSGRLVAVFYKRHLFGREVMLYRSWGRPQSPVKCSGTRVGAAICYDTMFTDVARSLARGGAEVILVPTSDPRLPGGLFNHLHSAVIAFRAAESGIPIAWSEPRGLSCVVDGDGRIVSQLAMGRSGVASGTVHRRALWTPYSVLGDWFAYACLICSGSLLLAAGLKKRSNEPRPVSS